MVSAELSWYGSVQIGVESNDQYRPDVNHISSRWGVKGSNEVFQGLTRRTALSARSPQAMLAV